jgi:hypothetical protein
VRFQTTPRWDTDWKSLEPEHKRQFRHVLPDFAAACDACAVAAGAYSWPSALRVKPMRSAPGIWELTWSFASPDGRATFEFVTDDDGLLVRWRRIGDHGIYRKP